MTNSLQETERRIPPAKKIDIKAAAVNILLHLYIYIYIEYIERKNKKKSMVMCLGLVRTCALQSSLYNNTSPLFYYFIFFYIDKKRDSCEVNTSASHRLYIMDIPIKKKKKENDIIVTLSRAITKQCVKPSTS